MGNGPDVFAGMKRLGGTIEGEFSQKSRASEYLEGKKEFAEGFCEGVCIDWIRRVLQEGRVAFSDMRAQSQTRRQAAVWSALQPRYAIIALSDRVKAVYNQQLGKDVTLPPDLEEDLVEYYMKKKIEFKCRPGRVYPRTLIENLYKDLDTRADSEHHTTTAGWAAFAHRLDDFHRKQREKMQQEAMKNAPMKGASRKPFIHIKIIDSAEETIYGSSVRVAIEKLLKLNGFQPKTALLLGFVLIHNGGKTGHAVAVFRPNDLNYVLFDPNVGVFRYKTQGEVVKALKYLFYADFKDGDFKGSVYPSLGYHATEQVTHILFAHA